MTKELYDDERSRRDLDIGWLGMDSKYSVDERWMQDEKQLRLPN